MHKLTQKAIQRKAYHESGHVTHALVVEIPFSGVWIRRSKDEPAPKDSLDVASGPDRVMGAVLIAEDDISHIYDNELVENCMAGLAGERILRNTKTAGKAKFCDVLSGCHGDFKMAWNYIDEHNNDDRSNLIITNKDLFVDMCLDEAWNLLKRHKEAHRAIAEALIERGYLSHEECKRLYEEATEKI